MNLALAIILAVLLDHWLGEPKKYHPLVYFGALADQLEAKLLQKNHPDFKQKTYGLIALIVLLTPIAGIIFFISQWSIINFIAAPLILYFCIAANSLKQHAIDIFDALKNHDSNLAKQRVAMIVSRQTEKMTNDDIRKATIESVLENGADAIFAPLFWFIILGPTGAIIYRLSNTLDAMWGYKNQHYLHFGWAAARFDDILNWPPARLTALSYALLGKTTSAFNCWETQAHLLDSPNAGPVMTAGAGALNLQLGGPAWYHGKLKDKIFFGTDKKPQNNDIARANSLITSALYLWICIIMILQIFGEFLA